MSEFTEEQRAIRQKFWVEALDTICTENPVTGNRPCDNGVLCDRCHFDKGVHQIWYSKMLDYENEEDVILMTDEERGKIDVSIPYTCRLCGEDIEIVAPASQWNEYFNSHSRRLIQLVFPDMPCDKREMLISGTCPTCWNKMFGD